LHRGYRLDGSGGIADDLETRGRFEMSLLGLTLVVWDWGEMFECAGGATRRMSVVRLSRHLHIILGDGSRAFPLWQWRLLFNLARKKL
jgi:hypothetical protein